MAGTSRILLAGISLAVVACASHNGSLESDAATPVAVRATVRVVNAETTRVTGGDRYELIARSRPEIAAFEPALDRLSATLHRVFPKDSLPHITATVRRVSGEGQSFTGPAPIPSETKGAVVELTLADPRHDGGEEQRARALEGRLADERVRPVLRAWLAAHAAAVSGSPARYSQLTGEVDDPRVPAWAYEAAESAALGRYLSREGEDLIGRLVDAQIQGKPLDDVLAARALGDMPRLESDWRYWVLQHASSENR